MVRELIERDLREHQAGRLSEANSLYEQALIIEPRHPDALHLAGVLAFQSGAAERAIRLLEQAVAVQPANPAFHGNLAQVYLESMLALLTLLDDYVGVSNTNMHLRAGVGRPARVLVPRPVEWRWMAAGDASPWFPGFRVYRQRTDGDWGEAFEQLRKDLAAAHGKP